MRSPKKPKLLFVSDDGLKFDLYIDGNEVALTRGVTIKAGAGEPIEVNAVMVIDPSCETIKPSSGESV